MLSITGLATFMVVNALTTSMIVFKILKVFLELKPTSVERSWGSLGSTEGSKFRRNIFIIIESGMALCAIQLVRVVLSCLPLQTPSTVFTGPLVGMQLVTGIHQVLNAIIRSAFFISASFGLLMNIYLARASHQQLFWCVPQ